MLKLKKCPYLTIKEQTEKFGSKKIRIQLSCKNISQLIITGFESAKLWKEVVLIKQMQKENKIERINKKKKMIKMRKQKIIKKKKLKMISLENREIMIV